MAFQIGSRLGAVTSAFQRSSFRVSLFVVAACWTVGSPSIGAQATPSAQTNHIRAVADDLRTRLDLPAVAIAVVSGGKLVASEAVGWADMERKVPITARHVFRVGSLSKLLTSTAAVRLQQAGRFDLDAPIRRYLPAVPDDKAAVTTRQILGHLAGFRHYGTDDYVSTAKFSNVDESLPRLLATPLLTPPGAKYAYSSYGYNVLGSVLQAASGQEFRALVRNLVTDPLKMSRTVAESLPAPADAATLYSRGGNNELVVAPPSDVSDRWPSGGYLSTAEELARFGTGILQPGFLNDALRDQGISTQRDADGRDTNVGLAWRIARDADGRRYVHHGGDAIGGRAFLLVYPDQRVSVAITTNVGRASFGEKDALAAVQPFNK